MVEVSTQLFRPKDDSLAAVCVYSHVIKTLEKQRVKCHDADLLKDAGLERGTTENSVG